MYRILIKYLTAIFLAANNSNYSLKTLTSHPSVSLTPDAVQGVINAIDQSRERALTDVRDHGTTGSYAVAARANLQYLDQARNPIAELHSWLHSNRLDTPFVSDVSAAANVHTYVREAIVSLEYARHWAMISAVYHDSRDAVDSFDRTTRAISLADSLGAEGGRCYMNGYVH